MMTGRMDRGVSGVAKANGDEFDEAETQRRFETALRAALNTPPKPMKDLPRKRAERKKRASADASS